MIRKWMNPRMEDGLPPGFVMVWMKVKDQAESKLGLYDPNLGIWQGVDSSESLEVTHWCLLEQPPSLLSSPDEAVLVANRLAGMVERVVDQVPAPWTVLDLESVEETVKAARRLRGRNR